MAHIFLHARTHARIQACDDLQPVMELKAIKNETELQGMRQGICCHNLSSSNTDGKAETKTQAQRDGKNNTHTHTHTHIHSHRTKCITLAIQGLPHP